MSHNNSNDQPQDIHRDHDDLSENISFDESTKYDHSVSGISTDDNKMFQPNIDIDINDDDDNGHNDGNDDDDDSIVIHSVPHPEEISRVTKKKGGSKAMQTFAGVAGNILEWYDFAVFGFFSDIIGRVFFPDVEVDPTTGERSDAGIIESFTVFGLAFLMRPIGGALMGYIGDLYGRKRALEISIFLMAFPTFAMGCLPSYDSVGRLSIVLLVLVRCLQGLSVGGQLVSSLVFTLEHNPRHQWGLYGSYVMAAANFGTLLGGLIATFLRANMTEEQLLSYGWRIPFLSGILVSLSGLYLKFYGEEDSLDHGHGAGGETIENPLAVAFRKENLRSLLSASLVPMVWSGGFYVSFVWMATFMKDLVVPEVPGAFLINSLSLFLSVCLLFPLAGILSDIFGRKKVMYTGGISLAILAPAMLSVISQGNPVAAFFAQCAIGIALSLWGAPMCAWLVESFPPAIRLTSVAVGYNIAQAIAGGASPALATYFADKFGAVVPGFMVSVLAIFSLIGLSLSNNDNVENLAGKPALDRGNSRDNLFSYDSDSSDKRGDSGEAGEMELI